MDTLIVLGIIMYICWKRGYKKGYEDGYPEGARDGQRDLILNQGRVKEFRREQE